MDSLIYMINKESPKKNFNIKNFFKEEEKIEQLMYKIEDYIYLHLKKQINSGADIIQIFDSWAGLLPDDKIKNFVLIQLKELLKN